MIEQIDGLRLKGRCFKNETEFVFFRNNNDRISIVYGKNGSGKSTISEGFSSALLGDGKKDISATLVNKQHQSVSITDHTNIAVFNEKYIDENVKIDDDGLGTIVLLGGQIDLQSEIDRQIVAVNSIEKELDIDRAEYAKYTTANSPLNPQYHWYRIESILKQSGGWAETDSRIKGNKRNSSVTADVIIEISKTSTKLSIAELQSQFDETEDLLKKVTESSVVFTDAIKKVIVDQSWEDDFIHTVSKKIEEPVLTDREKIILSVIQNGNQNNVESARTEFGLKSTEVCPYCFQPVSDEYKKELVNSINRVLNKDVDEHKRELKDIHYPDLAFNFSQYEIIDLSLIRAIEKQAQKCSQIIEQYREKVAEKEKNIYTPVIMSKLGLLDNIETINTLIDKLECERNKFNEASRKRKGITQKLISINKQIAYLQIYKTYKDYLTQKEAKYKIYNGIKSKEQQLTEEKENLQKLQQKKSNIGLAIENINNALDYIFFSKERLSIELRDDKYYLKSNGNNVKPKNVSLGERNAIALCYFFTQILSNQDISKLYENEMLVIIDDPVSSFDFENKVGINSFLRYQANRIINGNSKSKILIMSHDLETIFDLRKAMEEICQSTKGIAGINPTSSIALELREGQLSQLNKNYNEYGALLKKVYYYANGESSDDSIVIGNAMRRVLEAFSTFTYQKSIEKVSCDKNVLDALGEKSIFFENLMYRLVLHGESHYEEQVYSIHSGYNFYEFISEEEKRKTAKYILCFISLLNPYHINAYLIDINNAQKNIHLWSKSIPQNDSFKIQEPTPLRTIHLFELPLSAGDGVESLDDISYSDYQTYNATCDFALRITGDSMEPRIKNGSIVLVKRSDVIDEGKIGAFLYDGKMYCKYLSYSNGKTFLCSYNKSYDPIDVSNAEMLKTFGEVIGTAEE